MVESYHIERTEWSHSRIRSYVSHDQETQKLQQEVECLHRRLRRRECDRRSPSSLLSDRSRESKNRLYRHRSRTPSSESYLASSCKDKLEKSNNKHERKSSHLGIRNDAISKTLQQISKSHFVKRINKAKLPHQFSQPTFTIYNGRTDPVEHVSHFNQKMAIHANNEAFIGKVFPSSLGPVAMRWFNALDKGSVGFLEELMRAFEARFITCSRVHKPVDSLLSMVIREVETLKTYSNRY